jgi:hypothetical protein
MQRSTPLLSLLSSVVLVALAGYSPAHSQEEAASVNKHFKLTAEQIRPLATGRGGAIASDRITVDGRPVGYMYRIEPHNELDSGWAFLAGDESEAYMDNAANHAIYDVNTIANYDPEIIPLIDAPIGSAFIRTPAGLVRDPEGAPDQ